MTLREYFKIYAEKNRLKTQENDNDDCQMIAQFFRGKVGATRHFLNSLGNKVLDTDIDEN